MPGYEVTTSYRWLGGRGGPLWVPGDWVSCGIGPCGCQASRHAAYVSLVSTTTTTAAATAAATEASAAAAASSHSHDDRFTRLKAGQHLVIRSIG